MMVYDYKLLVGMVIRGFQESGKGFKWVAELERDVYHNNQPIASHVKLRQLPPKAVVTGLRRHVGRHIHVLVNQPISGLLRSYVAIRVGVSKDDCRADR